MRTINCFRPKAWRIVLVLACSTISTRGVTAQDGHSPRAIGPVIRASVAGLVGSVAAVRVLPDGKVIVNDIRRRQLVVFDSALRFATVILDSATLSTGTMGRQAGGLLSFQGDSSLYVDPSTLSMLVLDPAGSVARVIASPRPQDVSFLVGGPFGTPVLDSELRLIHRGSAHPLAVPVRQNMALPTMPDSAPIVRLDLRSRHLDTIGTYRIAANASQGGKDNSGRLRVITTINPVQVVDDWAALADHTLAVIRGKDFSIDFINLRTGSRSRLKVPFRWHRFTKADRTRILDSTQVEVDKELADMAANDARFRGFSVAVPPGVGAQAAPPTIVVVDEPSLPEYEPAFLAGSARGSPDGKLWVRTTERFNGAPVYYVIDPATGAIDRITLPRGRLLIGFGPRQTLFAASLDAVGARLEELAMR